MTTKYFNVKHGIQTGDIILDAGTGNANVTNANLGNLAVANFFQGDGYRLANLTGANVTGFVPNAVHANTANTVTTAAQPNITSVGTLVSANVSGNLVAANVKANTMLSTSDLTITGKITGDLIPSANLGYDIGSSTFLWRDLWLSGGTIHLGSTATISATSSGTIVASGDSNVSGNLNVTGDSALGNTATANYFIGKFDSTSSNQANITNVGTLGNLTVSGNVTTGGIKTDNYYYANGSPVDFQQTAGSTGAIQWNNNGDFGASANLSWNPSTSTLTVTGTVSTTDVTATTLGGSLTTASQPNITGIGTLGNLFVTANANVGNLNASGTSTITGNLSAGNIETGGKLKVTDTTQASGVLTGAMQVSGGASISKDLYVGGNLYVPNIISQSSVTIEVNDPLLYLNATSENPYDYDIGFYSDFSTGDGVGHQITGLFRNHSDNAWYVVSNLAEPASGVVDLSNANVVFDTFKTGSLSAVGNIEATGWADITGNITAGNVDGGNLVSASFLEGVITATSSSQPNITTVGTLTALEVTGNISGGNVNSLGEIHSVGNITAPYFIGNVSGNISGTLSAPGSNTQILFNDGGSINGNSKVTFDKSTSTFAVTGNITSTDANLGNAVTANYFIGSGANLTSLTGANVTGNVANANLAGYVTEAAQSNITSVGTLTGLGVNGTITASDITANTGVFTGNANGLTNIPGANVTGTVPNANMAAYAGNITLAAQSNITSVGTLTLLAVSGNITAGNANLGNAVTANFFIGDGYKLGNITGANVTGYVANADWANTATAATTAGTVTTNAQPNITSVGTLTSLFVSGETTTGTLKVTGGFTSNRSPITVNGNTVIDQFPTGTYRTAKYVVSADADDGYQSVEALLVHNDVGSYITIYGSITSGATDVIDLTTAVDGVSGNVTLYASNASPNAHVNLVATYV